MIEIEYSLSPFIDAENSAILLGLFCPPNVIEVSLGAMQWCHTSVVDDSCEEVIEYVISTVVEHEIIHWAFSIEGINDCEAEHKAIESLERE